MNAFIITGQDRPGELAKVAEAIAERGVNITNVSCLTWGGQGAIGITTNDEAATRSLLSSRGFDYREVELVPCSMDDRPGTLASTLPDKIHGSVVRARAQEVREAGAALKNR